MPQQKIVGIDGRLRDLVARRSRVCKLWTRLLDPAAEYRKLSRRIDALLDERLTLMAGDEAA